MSLDLLESCTSVNSIRSFISEIPIRPPATNDQTPVSWWDPRCCDRSLLIGTYKHGCENYRAIRADPKLCFATHCGPGEGVEEPTPIKE